MSTMNVHPQSTPLSPMFKSGLESKGLPRESIGTTSLTQPVRDFGTRYTRQSPPPFPHVFRFGSTHLNTRPGDYLPHPRSIFPVPVPLRVWGPPHESTLCHRRYDFEVMVFFTSVEVTSVGLGHPPLVRRGSVGSGPS